jgi:predicted CXXCH cytochrome family protein
MSSIGTSLIAFLVIATLMGLFFLLAIRALSGKELKVKPRSFMLTLLVPLLVGSAIIGVISFLEFHEQPVLCGDYCHAMDGVYLTYQEPANNSIMDVHATAEVTCLDCHTGPGVWGQIEIYAVVPNEVWQEMTGGYDIDNLGGHVEREKCTKCHDGDFATLPGEVTTAIGTLVDPHTIEGDCVDCHTPHETGIGLPEETCAICHGTTMMHFQDSLAAHGERVGRDCMECHDLPHPEGAQIPWSSVPQIIDRDFCSDCHAVVVDAYVSSATEFSLELYGDCTDCHSEHNESLPPHIVQEGWEDCVQCHVNFQHDTLMHNRTGVTYLGVSGVTDDFCADCHDGKSSSMPSIHRAVECSSCHSDHRLRVVFEDCHSCHDSETIPTWHDETLGGCWNEDCHGTWFYHD